MVLIERLELASLPVHAWLCWRHGGGQYVSWSRAFGSSRVRKCIEALLSLQQSSFETYPGTYFEVQQRSSTLTTDALCERNDPEYHSAHTVVRRIKPNQLMEIGLRKALAHGYVAHRIKTAVFARNLASGGTRVVLAPRDDRPVADWLPPDLASAWTAAVVPPTVRMANSFKARVHSLTTAAYSLAVIAVLVFQRGFTWRSRPRHWPVAYDIYDEGFNFKFPYHETFIYDACELRRDGILHVVRGRLRHQPTREHFEKHAIPYVESGRLPIPCDYFLRTIVGRMLPALLGAAFRGALRGDSAAFQWAAIQTVVQLVRAEVQWASYQSDVFIGRDEYSLMHILRTLVYEEHGARTVGFTHGDDCYAATANAYQVSSHFCFPGEAYRDLHAHGTRFSGRTSLIGAGVYGLDETFRAMREGTVPERYRLMSGRYRLIGAFGTSFTSDFYVTREMTLRFYRLLIEICREREDVILVLRPKGNEFEDDEEFRNLLIDAGPRVILDREEWTYRLIPALDLIVVIVYCTVGLDAMIAGKRALYFDESEMRPFPYEAYDPFLVARTPAELRDRLTRVLDHDEYPTTAAIERLQKHRSAGFDGQVVQRLRQVVCDELEIARANAQKRPTARDH